VKRRIIGLLVAIGIAMGVGMATSAPASAATPQVRAAAPAANTACNFDPGDVYGNPLLLATYFQSGIKVFRWTIMDAWEKRLFAPDPKWDAYQVYSNGYKVASIWAVDLWETSYLYDRAYPWMTRNVGGVWKSWNYIWWGNTLTESCTTGRI
jgi:hypothetical protein